MKLYHFSVQCTARRPRKHVYCYEEWRTPRSYNWRESSNTVYCISYSTLIGWVIVHEHMYSDIGPRDCISSGNVSRQLYSLLSLLPKEAYNYGKYLINVSSTFPGRDLQINMMCYIYTWSAVKSNDNFKIHNWDLYNWKFVLPDMNIHRMLQKKLQNCFGTEV